MTIKNSLLPANPVNNANCNLQSVEKLLIFFTAYRYKSAPVCHVSSPQGLFRILKNNIKDWP